jgi:hypothetical protein
MARIGKYNPKEVNLILGTRKITGYAPGTFIDVQYNNPDIMTPDVGAQGEYALVENPDTSGTITIVLQQDAADNAYLHALAASRSVFPAFGQRVGQTIREIFTSPEGWVQQRPGKGFDAAPSGRTWIIGAGDLQLVDSAV